jgi:hypothetical protein
MMRVEINLCNSNFTVKELMALLKSFPPKHRVDFFYVEDSDSDNTILMNIYDLPEYNGELNEKVSNC